MSSARCCQVHSNSRHNRWPCFSYKYLPISLWDHVKVSINGNIPYFYFDDCQAIRVSQTSHVSGSPNTNIYRIIRSELSLKSLEVTYLPSSRQRRRLLVSDLQILEIRYLLHYEIHIFPTQHKICKNESFNFKNGQ